MNVTITFLAGGLGGWCLHVLCAGIRRPQKPQRWSAYPDSDAFWRAEVDIEKELRGEWPPR